MDNKAFKALFQPLRTPIHSTSLELKFIENWLETQSKDISNGVDLTPDFQRGHVWSQDQQIHFVYNLLRGGLDQSVLTLQFNCPSWRLDHVADSDLLDQMVILDGLQRLTSLRTFVAGGFLVNGVAFCDLPLAVKRSHITVQMYDFQYRKELLQFYLDLNGGGIAHSQSELDRVRALLEDAR